MSSKKVRVVEYKCRERKTRVEDLEYFLMDVLNVGHLEEKCQNLAITLSKLLNYLAEKGVLSVDEVLEAVGEEDATDAERSKE